jgi:hypothetical protein
LNCQFFLRFDLIYWADFSLSAIEPIGPKNAVTYARAGREARTDQAALMFDNLVRAR